MRIKFYILWFDDERSWIDGKTRDVRDIVEEKGFEWVEPTICTKEAEFNGVHDYEKFDMILVDYQLVGRGRNGKTGTDIISKIRADCFTTIIFYSQNGERVLRKEIAEENLDGVFCADREDFLDRYENVFLSYIKKIEDINNLRGLVMAETADLESLSAEIIRLYDGVTCPEKKKNIKKVIKEMLKDVKKEKKIFESMNEDTTFMELLKWLSFYRKSITIDKINKRGTSVSDFVQSTFNDEIIVKRNLLAHVTESTEGGKVVLESRNKKLIFSQREAKQIRNDIKKYKNELEKIKDSLLQDMKL